MPASPRWKSNFARLANGLQVVAVETPHLAIGYVALLVGVGSRNETVELNGITHFLEHMVFRGTKSFPTSRSLNAAAESIGGFLDGATYRDHTLFSTTCHPSKFKVALELLGEIVTSPRFTDLQTEREIVREEMRESLGANGQMVDPDTVAHALMYPEHGLGQPIEGHLAALNAITRHDLRRHLDTYYTGPNAVLVIAGPCSLRSLLPKIRQCFDLLPAKTAPTPPVPKARHQKPKLKWVNDPGAQVDLRVCFPGLSSRDPGYDALNVLARVLGDGLSSRLHAELVDKKGLAYSLSAGPESFADCGSFDFDVTVAPDKVGRAVSELLKFARSVERLPPSREELEQVRQRYAYTLDFMNDAPADLGLWFGRSRLFKIDDDFERSRKRFLAVTASDCRSVARRIFSSGGVVVVGVGAVPRRQQQIVRESLSRYAN